MDVAPKPGHHPLPARSWAPRSAYLHLPFCHRRCFYCDFPVVPLGDHADGSRSASIPAYLELLRSEIRRSPAGPPLSTIYLGGGTPSMLTADQIGDLLDLLRERYGMAAGAEISLELDPASFDEQRLLGYLAAGVNRVSLGAQSFDDAVLEALGRRHRRADLLEALGWLRQAGRRGHLRSWSLDLIQGLPGQDGRTELIRHWRDQLAQALGHAPPHVSVYDLRVEPGTVFARRQDQGELPLPPDDAAADLMDLTAAFLSDHGYGRYEISNYALPGHACRHNRIYWSGAAWWAFGMGATSAPAGQRVERPRTREAYAAWLAGPESSPAASPPRGILELEDLLIVGLRRREGVNLVELASSRGISRASITALRRRLAPFLGQGVLLIEGPRWRLSDPAGLAVSNAVLTELLLWCEQQPEA